MKRVQRRKNGKNVNKEYIKMDFVLNNTESSDSESSDSESLPRFQLTSLEDVDYRNIILEGTLTHYERYVGRGSVSVVRRGQVSLVQRSQFY